MPVGPKIPKVYEHAMAMPDHLQSIQQMVKAIDALLRGTPIKIWEFGSQPLHASKSKRTRKELQNASMTDFEQRDNGGTLVIPDFRNSKVEDV